MGRHGARSRRSHRHDQRQHRLDRIEGAELLLAFPGSESDSAGLTPASSGRSVARTDHEVPDAQTAPREEAVLTLGATPTVVPVRPAPPGYGLTYDDYAPLLEGGADARQNPSPPLGRGQGEGEERGNPAVPQPLPGKQGGYVARSKPFWRPGLWGRPTVKTQFSWRRLGLSAAVWSGLGSAALLVIHWLIG